MSQADQNNKYVLVIDTDVDERFYTCMLLQQFGHTIFTAHSAQEAIEFMTVSPPVAILADADLNGPALHSWLMKDPRFFDIPLIMLGKRTDNSLQRSVTRGELGAFLVKPISADILYRTIQEVIEKGPRKNIRIAARLPVKLLDQPGGNTGYATVISEYGMFFRTLEPRPVNTVIPLVLEINSRLLSLESVVLYTVSFDEGPFKEPGMGMKFKNISRSDREFIAAYIRQHVEGNRAPQSDGR